MKWSLRNRILVPTTALMAATITAICLVFFFMSRSALTEVIDAELMQISADGIAKTESWVEQHRLNVSQLSGQIDMVAALQASPDTARARSQVSQSLAKVKNIYGEYEIISLSDTKGVTVASSNLDVIGKDNVAEKQYFKDAMDGKTVISKVMASRATGAPVLVVAAPIKNAENILGTIYIVINMNRFSQKFLTNIKVLQTGQCYLVDETGICLAHPDSKLILKANMSEYDWGKKMMSMKEGRLSYDFGIPKSVAFKTSEMLGWRFIATAPDAELNAPANRMGRIGVILGTCSLFVSVLVILLAVRSVTRPIQGIADQISDGSDQTFSASGQVSASSQSLAEGSSEQAASLEETSSSLEEMASMTKRNADNAQRAKALSNETRVAADAGTKDMDEMKHAMDAVKASSDDIAKIIKTIDEIAFQTNILALNAAVEAARAGEAGAGFAVVADEVRSLAQRSAQSAKETAAKIEDAINKSEHGVRISSKVSQSLAVVAEKTRLVDTIVAEIATASKEQSQGIEQVNMAVNQMDKITQSNAANAEETASAAEELTAQAEALKDVVAGLRTLVDGASRKQEAGRKAQGNGSVRTSEIPLPRPVLKSDSPAKGSRQLTAFFHDSDESTET